MREWKVAAAGAAVLAVAVLAGCVPVPNTSASATPSGLATEAQAFAAAESTYRAYIETLNDDRVEPDRAGVADEFLIGSALEDSIATQQRADSAGLRLDGESIVRSVESVGTTGPPSFLTVKIRVCIDFSKVRVVNGTGEDVTPTDRPTNPLDVTLERVGDRYLIEDSVLSASAQC